MIHCVVIDHADDGHAEIAAYAEGDAKSNTRENGDDVAARHPKAGAVHNGQFLLLHHLWPSLGWQLDGLAILLSLLEDPGG